MFIKTVEGCWYNADHIVWVLEVKCGDIETRVGTTDQTGDQYWKTAEPADEFVERIRCNMPVKTEQKGGAT